MIWVDSTGSEPTFWAFFDGIYVRNVDLRVRKKWNQSQH